MVPLTVIHRCAQLIRQTQSAFPSDDIYIPFFQAPGITGIQCNVKFKKLKYLLIKYEANKKKNRSWAAQQAPIL